MSIPVELLWKAYPKGYLSRKGVTSIGGWHCVMSIPGASYWVVPNFIYQQENFKDQVYRTGHKEVELARERGDLLPELQDTATWFCLLADLAEATSVVDRPWSRNNGYLWVKGTEEERRDIKAPPFWKLIIVDSGGWTDRLFNVDADDPNLALVLARIECQNS